MHFFFLVKTAEFKPNLAGCQQSLSLANEEFHVWARVLLQQAPRSPIHPLHPLVGQTNQSLGSCNVAECDAYAQQFPVGYQTQAVAACRRWLAGCRHAVEKHRGARQVLVLKCKKQHDGHWIKKNLLTVIRDICREDAYLTTEAEERII